MPVITFTPREKQTVLWMARIENHRFSAAAVGKRLHGKLLRLGWIHQSGWFLSGIECYAFDETARKMAIAMARTEL